MMIISRFEIRLINIEQAKKFSNKSATSKSQNLEINNQFDPFLIKHKLICPYQECINNTRIK